LKETWIILSKMEGFARTLSDRGNPDGEGSELQWQKIIYSHPFTPATGEKTAACK
jgi:hypothetical protein